MTKPDKPARKRKKNPPTGNPPGRPPKLKPDEKTLATIRGLGKIQSTTREAAAVLGCNHETFLLFVRNDPGKTAYEDGKAEGCASLRRTQFALAQTNAGMAIFLGKNLLGQADKQEFSGSIAMDMTTTINIAAKP